MSRKTPTRGSIKIFLIGPSGVEQKFLDYRRYIRKQLREMGYTNVIVMEDIIDEITEGGIVDKFAEILRMYGKPYVFAFFHKKERMDAVMFEIGYICGYYHKLIKHRLHFLHEKNYNFEKETTAYMDSLLVEVKHASFNDSEPFRTAVAILHRMIAVPQ